MATIASSDACTPFNIETREQRSRESRNPKLCAIVSSFLLGMMVATIAVLTVAHYGLGDASFTKSFFASALWPGDVGTSVGAQVSPNRNHHWGGSPVSIHQPILPSRSQQMSMSLPDMRGISPPTMPIDGVGTIEQTSDSPWSLGEPASQPANLWKRRGRRIKNTLKKHWQNYGRAITTFLLFSSPLLMTIIGGLILLQQKRQTGGMHHDNGQPSVAPAVPFGVRVAATVGAAALHIPTPAFAADNAAALSWLPSWRKDAHHLGIFFAQTLISWGVPIAAIGIVGILVLAGGEEEMKKKVPPPLAKVLGLTNEPNEPKEYLQIEKLNAKIESFEYSFKKAKISQASALRAKTKADVERQFGAEFQSFNLDKDTVFKICKAAATYRAAEEKVTKRLEGIAASFREATLMQAATENRSLFGNMFGNMFGRAKNTKDNTASEAALEDGSVPTSDGKPATAKALKPLAQEKAKLEKTRTQLELDFLRQLSSILTKDQAAALATVLRQADEHGGISLGRANTGGPTRLDTLGALVTAANEAAGEAKCVYVLKFFGDGNASQVAQLREEVTAVLQTANVEGRGDEVVLVLDSGGGTVTGYGLATAQLLRLKQAKLHLTICVDQVAASGGYEMACVADKIVAAPFAEIGSIGVISEIPNFYERLEREGVKYSTVTAGKYKRTLTEFKKIEPADLKKEQEDLQDVLKLFKRFVADNRPQVNIDEIATGEIWYAPDALKRHLVDEISTTDDVLLGHVRAGADVFGITYKEKSKSPLSALLDNDGEASSMTLLALAWLVEKLGSSSAGVMARQIDELKATVKRLRGGQRTQGMLKMTGPQPLAQLPTDVGEPMLSWGVT